MYFNKDNPVFSIKAIAVHSGHLNLDIIECNPQTMIWEQVSPDESFAINYTVKNLLRDRFYLIYGDGILLKKIKSDSKGILMFDQSNKHQKIKIVLEDTSR